MEIEIVSLKRSLLWTSINVPNLLATLDGKVVGSYHGVGCHVQATVAGVNLPLDIEQVTWEIELELIENSCTEALASEYFANWAVRFSPEDDYIGAYLEDVCLSARYDDKRSFWMVKYSDTKYLEYLGVRLSRHKPVIEGVLP